MQFNKPLSRSPENRATIGRKVASSFLFELADDNKTRQWDGLSHGYLYRTLAQGARPFLYRSGVRLLLGLAAAGAGNNLKMTFYRIPPPVGFRYARFPLMSAAIRGPRGAGSLLESASLRSSSVKDLQSASSESNLQLLRAKVDDKVPGKVDEVKFNKSFCGVQAPRRGEPIEVENEKVPGKEVGKVGKEVEQVEPGRVEADIKVTCKKIERDERVPAVHDGAPSPEDYEISQKLLEVQKPFLEKVSGRRRLINFVVGENEKVPGKVEEVDIKEQKVPGKIEQQEHQEIDIPGFSQESISVPSLFSKTGTVEPGIPNTGTSSLPLGTATEPRAKSLPGRWPDTTFQTGPAGTQRIVVPGGAVHEPPLLKNIRPGNDKRVPGMPGKVDAKVDEVDDKRVPASHEAAPRPGTMKFNKSFCGVQGPAARGANKGFLQKEPLAAEDSNPSRREMVRAVQQVERLRQEVHRLHSRVLAASRDHTETRETGEEKRSLPSSPQPRPVMAFTPPGPQRRRRQTLRIPCAFWERNYLGRFHLRMSR